MFKQRHAHLLAIRGFIPSGAGQGHPWARTRQTVQVVIQGSPRLYSVRLCVLDCGRRSSTSGALYVDDRIHPAPHGQLPAAPENQSGLQGTSGLPTQPHRLKKILRQEIISSYTRGGDPKRTGDESCLRCGPVARHLNTARIIRPEIGPGCGPLGGRRPSHAQRDVLRHRSEEQFLGGMSYLRN